MFILDFLMSHFFSYPSYTSWDFRVKSCNPEQIHLLGDTWWRNMATSTM